MCLSRVRCDADTAQIKFLPDNTMEDQELATIPYVQRQLPLYSWYKPVLVAVIKTALWLHAMHMRWLGFSKSDVDPLTGIVKWTRSAETR